jgi:bifunctional non-homologous end joining protein LigD
MLATPAAPDAGPPPGPQWSHEVKWDGMRVLADIQDGVVRLRSRAENDVTATFPDLVATLPELADAHLDGEVVAFRDGRPDFAALAERMHVRDRRRAAELAELVPVTVMVFDVVRLYGVDLTARPLAERRATLERLDLAGPGDQGRWQVPPVYDDGEALAVATLSQGLEGVVSKRLGSRYQPGRRSPDWIKLPHRTTITAVVGGWRPEVGTSSRIGALLLGLPDGSGGLVYLGRAGSGLTRSMAADLARDLAPLRRDTSPFAPVDGVADAPRAPGSRGAQGAPGLPRDDAEGAVWCEPRICVDVRHMGHRDGGRLRQPVLRGRRPDLTPEELRDEH